MKTKAVSAGAATRRTRRLTKAAQLHPAPAAPRFIKLSAAGKRWPDVAPEWVAVLDTTTGLTWTRSVLPCGALPQPKAVAVVLELRLAGNGRWRAPTIAERVGITDYSRVEPALDPRYFDAPQKYGIEWTSTLCASSPGVYAWGVGFGYGGADGVRQSYEGFVRGVRGAPAGEVE